ncbi:MAG: DNA alkylation repair protein, partial [Pseudobdellovibrionaceae bacterium]
MEPFKNLLGYEAAKKIAKALKKAEPSFDESLFLLELEKKLAPLELKDRMLELTERLKRTLPKSQKESFAILVNALQSNSKNEHGISGFLVWPFTQFVADEGLAHFELSMQTLKEMTQVFTGEWAIRAFLIHNEQKTLKQMAEWAQDANEHVRRLASEGSRPLLPWGQKLYAIVEDPEKTWPILEKLKNDSSLYVRKSVANHLNDHSKNHGDWVIEKLNSWKSSKKIESEIDWIIRHATRTLVKK